MRKLRYCLLLALLLVAACAPPDPMTTRRFRVIDDGPSQSVIVFDSMAGKCYVLSRNGTVVPAPQEWCK